MSKSYVNVKIDHLDFFNLFEEFLETENQYVRIYRRPIGQEGGSGRFTIRGKEYPSIKLFRHREYCTIGDHEEFATRVHEVVAAFLQFLDKRGITYTILD